MATDDEHGFTTGGYTLDVYCRRPGCTFYGEGQGSGQTLREAIADLRRRGWKLVRPGRVSERVWCPGCARRLTDTAEPPPARPTTP